MRQQHNCLFAGKFICQMACVPEPPEIPGKSGAVQGCLCLALDLGTLEIVLHSVVSCLSTFPRALRC